MKSMIVLTAALLSSTASAAADPTASAPVDAFLKAFNSGDLAGVAAVHARAI